MCFYWRKTINTISFNHMVFFIIYQSSIFETELQLHREQTLLQTKETHIVLHFQTKLHLNILFQTSNEKHIQYKSLLLTKMECGKYPIKYIDRSQYWRCCIAKKQLTNFNRKHISPVYMAQINPGSTRVKTNPGCVYTTLFQTNLSRTRVSSDYTTN